MAASIPDPVLVDAVGRACRQQRISACSVESALWSPVSDCSSGANVLSLLRLSSNSVVMNGPAAWNEYAPGG